MSTLRFASVLLALASLASVACATSEDDSTLPPPVRPPDAAALDSSGFDTSNGDTSASDSSDATTDTASPCEAGATETRPCGMCGSQNRYCTGSSWSDWTTCSGEMTGADCSVGEVRASDCGMCGTQKDTCDPTTCTWITGACTGAGVCNPGETQTTTASCANPGEIRTKTCTDKCAWSAFGACTLPTGWLPMTAPPAAIDGRYYHSAVWSGTEMIVFGGYGSYVSSGPSYYLRNNGGAYNFGADSWRTIAAAPSVFSTGRWQHTAVWTGSKMIVWGGLGYYSASTSYAKNDGAIYDPSLDSWASMSTPSTLSARYGHAAVWSTTTNEMIVWGGQGATCAGTYCNDGASYNPATDTWTTIPTPPIAGRWKHSMIWTGSELVIWGGYNSSGSYLRDGARYDPKTKIWTKFPDPPADIDGRYDHVAVWSGKEMLIFGGYGNSVGSSYAKGNGARYLPGGSWTEFTTPPDDIFATGTSAKRYAIQAWYGNGKLWMWSGLPGTSSSGYAVSGGVSYDPATDTWTTMDLTGAPTTNRTRASVVWTGKEAILWGGTNYSSGSTYYADGAVYRP